MPNYSKKIVYLSDAQRQELFTNNTVTVNGTTITYNDNDIYVTPQTAPITDVKINNVSIGSNGVANIPIADANILGTVKINPNFGIGIYNGELLMNGASESDIKSGTNSTKAVSSYRQHQSVFYGLSKVAGVDLKNETVTVGTYPDFSKAAIQNMLGISDLIASRESSTATAAHSVGSLFLMDGKLHRATNAIGIGDAVTAGSNCEVVNINQAFPHDVQINNTSIVSNGVANIPEVSSGNLGLVKMDSSGTYGFIYDNIYGLQILPASGAQVKAGTDVHRPLVAGNQHKATFYGLAKAAGDITQSSSDNAVGTYTDSAKTAIRSMLGVETGTTLIETVSGTTPALTCQPNVRYNCGEVSTINITPPASGTCDIFFTSGSTATSLTVPNTVKFPVWFDATALSKNTIYEIMITDGVYGSVMTWAIS